MASQTQSAASSVNMGATNTQETVVRVIATKRNQEVWQHFDLCELSNGEKKARCKHCGKFYAKDANSTLKSHIQKRYCKALKNEAGSSSQPEMTNQGTVFTYDVEAVRQQFSNFVIQQTLPFNHFDNPQFTEMMQTYVQPRYQHVSRSTLRRDCLKAWKNAKSELISYFENLKTGVNLTTDVWSVPHGSPDSYICVTAHWVDPESWLMMKRTIAFQMFDYPHTGRNIFLILDKVIRDFKIEEKILSISFDNASNNTAAVGHLKLKYKPICNGAFFHSRCIAHIINLAVQDGLNVIETQRNNFKRMLRDVFSNNKTFSRYKKFCKEANCQWLGPNWDCVTRWNSTCTMFEKAIQQKESLIAFHQIMSSRSKCAPYDPRNWILIETITEVLQIFKSCTTSLSGVYYPTSPIALPKIAVMCTKLSELDCRGAPFNDMGKKMKEKFRKYFEELPAVLTCAAALNPCINVGGVESLIEKICDELGLNTAENPCFNQTLSNTFNAALSNMYDVYLTRYGSSSQIHDSLRAVAQSQSQTDLEMGMYYMIWEDAGKRQKVNTPNSEIGRYSATNFVKHMTPDEFRSLDLLAWWRGKEDEFPILAAMAKDLLTVQASTVASESAFSVSGRVISIRRTRLTAPAIEMTICYKDYLDSLDRAQHQRSLEGELEYEAGLYEDEVNEGYTQPMTDEEAAFDEYLRNSSESGSGGEEN